MQMSNESVNSELSGFSPDDISFICSSIFFKNAAHLENCKLLVLATKGVDVARLSCQELLCFLKSKMPEIEAKKWEWWFRDMSLPLEEVLRIVNYPGEESHRDLFKRVLGNLMGRKVAGSPLVGDEKKHYVANHKYCMNQNKCGRHLSARATVYVLLTFVLYDKYRTEVADLGFRADFEKLFDEELSPLRSVILDNENIFFVYCFMRFMLYLLPLDGNRAVFILVASIVSGCGTYQQRGSKATKMHNIFSFMVERLNGTRWEDIQKSDKSTRKRKLPCCSGSTSSDSHFDPDSVQIDKRMRNE